MAVSVAGSVITMTAQGDKVSMPLKIKSMHWIGATTQGHLLNVTESSDIVTSPGSVHKDDAAGADYVGRSLYERYAPHGIEIEDMDSGQLQVVYA